MSEVVSFEFGQPGDAIRIFHSSRVSTQPYVAVTEALQDSIAHESLKLLYEIDVQNALGHAGHTVLGARLMFFFHPRLVYRVLQLDWSAMVEAPLKFLVIEQSDGTTVRWADPAVAFARYNNPAPVEFGQDLSAVAARIVENGLNSLDSTAARTVLPSAST